MSKRDDASPESHAVAERLTEFPGQKLGLRVNVGCGMTPTEGFQNFDGSASVKLASFPPAVTSLLRWLGLLNAWQCQFIDFVRSHDVRWADVTKKIPLPDASCDVVYASHMIEHLTRRQASRFLAEARRVLRGGGVLRLVVPDLRQRADAYLQTGDADSFVESTLLAHDAILQETFKGRLQSLIFGAPGHKWMYDGESLTTLLINGGFSMVQALPAGETTISTPGALDLFERRYESVFVEAVR